MLIRPANGHATKPRGQGPRAEARAARRVQRSRRVSGARVMSAGVTPSNITMTQAARPPDLRRAAPASVACWAAISPTCLLSCVLRATRPAAIVEQAWPVLRTTLGVLFGHASYEAFSTALGAGNSDTDITGTTHASLGSYVRCSDSGANRSIAR